MKSSLIRIVAAFSVVIACSFLFLNCGGTSSTTGYPPNTNTGTDTGGGGTGSTNRLVLGELVLPIEHISSTGYAYRYIQSFNTAKTNHSGEFDFVNFFPGDNAGEPYKTAGMGIYSYYALSTYPAIIVGGDTQLDYNMNATTMDAEIESAITAQLTAGALVSVEGTYTDVSINNFGIEGSIFNIQNTDITDPMMIRLFVMHDASASQMLPNTVVQVADVRTNISSMTARETLDFNVGNLSKLSSVSGVVDYASADCKMLLVVTKTSTKEILNCAWVTK